MARLYLTAPEPAEDDLHEQVAKTLKVLLRPPVEFTCFPSGGYGLTPAAAARLYRLGLATGWPDILILHAAQLYGIELKARRGQLSRTRIVHGKRGRPRIVVGQQEMHPRLRAAGMRVEICRSLDAVLDQVRAWGIPTGEGRSR